MQTLFISLGAIALTFDFYCLTVLAFQLADAHEYGLSKDTYIIGAMALGTIANGSLIVYFIFYPLFAQYV